MPRILHFADAHIDMANYGKHDPETGLPLRVLDFLKSLDTIVNTAIDEKVDMVLFAGDAYKDRSPAPTYQREWGRRMMRLSRAGILTLLLVGNHDLSPASGRAHAMQEYDTLDIPHVRVLGRPELLGPRDLDGLPLQVLALPWISRATMVGMLGLSTADPNDVYQKVEGMITEVVDDLARQADPALPLVFTAHASVQGATYGGERMIMLGGDLVLPGSLVRSDRFDYVALGHIHKPQNLNEHGYPPVIYPGSIERVDFGEAREDRCFVIADVQRSATTFEWRKLHNVRPFIDRFVRLEGDPSEIGAQLLAALPAPDDLRDAIVRLNVEYPRAWEAMLDDSVLREHREAAFELHLLRRPQSDARVRLSQDQAISSLTPLDLLEKYWLASHTPGDDIPALQKLAEEYLRE